MTDYKPGDRVRVSFEGTVDHVFANGSLDVSGPDDFYTAVWPSSPYTVEKLTPDYKAQIEALEPGTAFVLSVGSAENVFFKVDDESVIDKGGSRMYIRHVFAIYDTVTDLRILK